MVPDLDFIARKKNGHKLVPDVNLSFETSPIFMAFVVEMDRIDKFY